MKIAKDEFMTIRTWANENAVSASLNQSAPSGTLQNEEFIGGRIIDF